MTNEDTGEIAFRHSETGEIMTLNKKERILIKEILAMTLKVEKNRKFVRDKLGEESIELASSLFKSMGGSE